MPMTLLAASGGSLEEIASSFGLDWAKFFAQILVFLIVFVILKWKAFGPVMEMLEKRRQRIAAGEENLKKIQADLEQAEAKAAEIVSAADSDAQRLIEEARESAQAIVERKSQEAVAEANQIIAKAREAIELEKEQASAQLRREFGRLVVDTTSKVTGKVLTKEDHESINQETAAQMAI